MAFIFYEHAMGYALFRTAEFENLESFILQIEARVLNSESFSQIIELVAFQAFSNGQEALEFMNNCSEGILSEKLFEFLKINLQNPNKEGQVILLIQEAKLAAVISENLSIECITNKVIEIMKGIRVHFCNLVPDVNTAIASKAHLLLGHHYSRSKIQFNVNRMDNNVIQSISLIDQMDKDINTFSMRVKEWYSFHFPELSTIVPDSDLYIKCVRVLRDRKNLDENIQEQLETILNDREKVQNIIELTCTSIGRDIMVDDVAAIITFAKRVESLINRRKTLSSYLKSKMQNVAPNLSELIGETIGAQLIAHAGSLSNLAKFPSSTVQILGAEKALFSAIKCGGKTPKHGIIFHSPYILKQDSKKMRGKIARYLASKCTTVSRIDCFQDCPTGIFGSELKQQVQNYADGEPIAGKNIDVMEKASFEEAKRKAEKEEKKRETQLIGMSKTSVANISTTEQKNIKDEVFNTEKKKKHKKKSVKYQTDELPKKRLSGEMQEAQAINEDAEKEQTEEEKKTAVKGVKKMKKSKKKERKELEESRREFTVEGAASCSVKADIAAKNVDVDEVKVKKKKKHHHR